MIIIGYLSAVLIGLFLGLLGGGGSIMTVPIFVYLIGFSPKTSIALSLAVVGAVSLVGVFKHWKLGHVNFKIVALFSPFAMSGTFLGARLSQKVSGSFQLILFATVMLIAAIFMLRKSKKTTETKEVKQKTNYSAKDISLIALEGIAVGILTGLVGVGGGFLIVPALVLLTKLPMKEAIGSSLLIISLKSFAGFYGYLDQVTVDWGFLMLFIGIASVGIIIGTYLINFISQEQLKKSFAVFLIIMGVFILYKNRNKLLSVKNAQTYLLQKQSHA
ncbi:MAG: sulfite exporter TauE/SafE family protein [Bdellovibrionaceae bacterium]|nr:sulfite exporter TauE/SafE family protein [Pseudobdellovibrionaceae bacterium]